MATKSNTNVLDFLLNREEQDKQAVAAPAFSLTKVLAVAAPVVTVVAGFIADKWDQVALNLQAVHFTALTIAVLAFVAIGAAADVLARSIAVRGEATAQARSAKTGIVRFAAPIPAYLLTDEDNEAAHEDVRIVAASDASPPQYLVIHGDDELTWREADEISFTKPE